MSDQHQHDQHQYPQQPDKKHINLLRSLYFLGGISGATWGRFSTIFFNQILHLTPSQIGLIEATMPATRLIFTPIWGIIADVFHAKKEVYLITSFIASSILLLQAFPTIASGFLPVLFINAGLSCFVASGVLDAYTLEYLAKFDQTRRYGTIRLWTAISWGIGNVVMGYITDHYAFFYNFVIFGAFAIIRMLSTWYVIPSERKETMCRCCNYNNNNNNNNNNNDDTLQEQKYDALQDQLLTGVVNEGSKRQIEEYNTIDNNNRNGSNTDKDTKASRSSKEELFAVLLAPSFLFFLFEVAIIGAGIGVVERLLFIYLQSDLQASTFLCGLTVLVNVIFELPIFIYTDVLLKRLGHDGMFIFAMFFYVIRAFGYTFLTVDTVYFVLALEALHGFTFALMWAAAVEFSKTRSPKGWTTTIQAIVTTSWRCLGVGIGSGVGGYVAEYKGFPYLYRGAGIIVGAVCVLHILMLGVCRCIGLKKGGGVLRGEAGPKKPPENTK